jgi:hypothetical protein
VTNFQLSVEPEGETSGQRSQILPLRPFNCVQGKLFSPRAKGFLRSENQPASRQADWLFQLSFGGTPGPSTCQRSFHIGVMVGNILEEM